MNELRIVIAVSLFLCSCYLVYDLIANGFHWAVLIACVGGFILAHYCWPKHSDGDSWWYDLLDLIINLPFRTIAVLLRSIGRVKKDGGVDIDIDI